MSNIQKEFQSETEKETKKINWNEKLNIKFLNKILFSMIIIFCLVYVATNNDLIVKGFKLQDLKTEVAKLQETNKNYELEAMNLEAYNSISKRVERFNMVAVGDEVDYLTITNMAVARK